MNLFFKTNALMMLIVSAFFIFPPNSRAEIAADTNAALCVMTYNLRYASPKPPNAWPQRRPVMRELITNTAPDIIGTQEGLNAQLLDLAADLPDYKWVGVGRDDGKTKGEFTAVFYRAARLEPLATNHFWLSDTPEIAGSATWGNRYNRMVTCLKFHDRRTGGEFFVFNTHFDHEAQAAREKSAALVRARVAALGTDLPVLLLGDFNAAAETNQAYKILMDEKFFDDVWKTAGIRHNEGIGTFNNFQPGLRSGPRIDWILTRGSVAVEQAETVTFSRDGNCPAIIFRSLHGCDSCRNHDGALSASVYQSNWIVSR